MGPDEKDIMIKSPQQRPLEVTKVTVAVTAEKSAANSMRNEHN
jgi:hypothetical protein